MAAATASYIANPEDSIFDHLFKHWSPNIANNTNNISLQNDSKSLIYQHKLKTYDIPHKIIQRQRLIFHNKFMNLRVKTAASSY